MQHDLAVVWIPSKSWAENVGEPGLRFDVVELGEFD